MPSDLRFAEIRALLEHHGWHLDRVNGSHHIFTGPMRPMVPIPVHNGRVSYAYKRFVEKTIAALDKEPKGD